MAEQKGTGQHKHKSSEEPYPHNEGKSGKSSHDEGTSQRSSTSNSGSSQHSGSSKQSASGSEGSRGGSSSNNEDLKSREYKDKDGEVHHHTKKYEEQHRGKE